MEKKKSGKKKSEKKKSQLSDLAKDVVSVLAIVAVFLVLCQVFFGLWTPMFVVSSGSMEPNMKVGDIVFVKDFDRTEIITQQEASVDNNHKKFNGQGDVILYYPYGDTRQIPIIHRAMYYVESGQPMWKGGPNAPHSGYITKGDNVITNSLFDQQTGISAGQPIKDEWVLGVSQFKIPYIGKIRLIFS